MSSPSRYPHQYFYPRPPRGGRPAPSYNGHPVIRISIHALREEGDPDKIQRLSASWKFLSTPSARRATGSAGNTLRGWCISIHALREEGDVAVEQITSSSKLFLSTPSARRATTAQKQQQNEHSNFYPRPPRGGRLYHAVVKEPDENISIHALREEGDRASLCNH